MKTKQKTKEDKVADKIVDLVNDVTLDLEEVGKIIATGYLTMSYNRVILLAEAAAEERENQSVRQFNTLF